MKKDLKCPVCGSDLELNIGYSGADWNCEAGEGSNFNYVISLDCTNDRCAGVFRVGYLRNPNEFSRVIEKYKTYK